MLRCCYQESFTERDDTVLREGKRNAPVQSHECVSLGREGEVVEIADELNGVERSGTAADGEQSVQSFCGSSVKLVVRLKRRCGEYEIQKLMVVTLDVSLDAKNFVGTWKDPITASS